MSALTDIYVDVQDLSGGMESAVTALAAILVIYGISYLLKGDTLATWIQQWRKKEQTRTVLCNVDPSTATGLNSSTLQPSFPSNVVSTAKYSIVTFFPRNFWEQFSHPINMYFLVIACVQLWTIAAPVNPITIWIPVLLIFTVSTAKEAVDDWRRRQRDHFFNHRLFTIIRQGSLINDCPSKDILVGDIIKIEKDEEIPADVIICGFEGCSTSGDCMLETANLDGESNLKRKCAASLTTTTENEPGHILQQWQLIASMQAPSPAMSGLQGRLTMMDCEMSCAISDCNMALQGCVLRRNAWMWGLVCYTGGQTKLGMSSPPTRSKFALLDRRINRLVVCIFILQIALIACMSCCYAIMTEQVFRHSWYLSVASRVTDEDWYAFFVVPVRYMLLFSLMIPVSLRVSLEICKMYLAWTINNDLCLYDPALAQGGHCATSGIVEDLGVIEVVFSDKTGTLTENRMVFAGYTVGNGNGVFVTSGAQQTETDHHPHQERARELAFLRTLALCHEGRPQSQLSQTPPQTGQQEREYSYSSPFPDEEAILAGLSRQERHIVLQHRHNRLPFPHTAFAAAFSPDLAAAFRALVPVCDCLVLEEEAEEEAEEAEEASSQASQDSRNYVQVRYYELALLPFTAERKRMSTLVWKEGSQAIWLLCKGADEVMLPRGTFEQVALATALGSEIENMATNGLRTLCVGWRQWTGENAVREAVLTPLQQLHLLRSALDCDSQAVGRVQSEMESCLTLLGACGVRDRMQEGVPATIAALRDAGIRIVMITGDKKATALQIAEEAGIIPAAPVKCCDLSDPSAEIHHSSVAEYAYILVDGVNLGKLLSPQFEPLLQQLLQRQVSIICCRMAPAQKAQIVSHLCGSSPASLNNAAPHQHEHSSTPSTLDQGTKRGDKDVDQDRDRTSNTSRSQNNSKRKRKSLLHYRGLAIGDGGNDVAMLQTARVGVGIYGREGQHAARSADFALPSFRHLQRLLLFHGHTSLYRTSTIALYSFYKTMVLCLCQLYYGLVCGFSGSSLFTTLQLTLFNTLYTSVPVMLLLLDLGRDPCDYLRQPTRYLPSQLCRYFSLPLTATWLLRATYESAIIVGGCLLFFYTAGGGGAAPQDGSPTNWEELSLLIYGILLLNITLTLAMITRRYTLVHMVGYPLFVGIFVLSMGVLSFLPPLPVGPLTSTETLMVLPHLLLSPLTYATTLLLLVWCQLPSFLFLHLQHVDLWRWMLERGSAWFLQR
jgi:phospholipid-translocating P-type ATPase (flippase)